MAESNGPTSLQKHEGRPGHIVSANMFAWGHTKAACSLLCKLVRLRNIYVTFLVAQPHYERVLQEISRQFLPKDEDDVKSMIRVVSVEAEPLPKNLALLQHNYLKCCKDLISGKPLEARPGSGILHDDVGPPQLLLLDFFLYDMFQEFRKITNGSIPIYAFQSGAVAGILFLFGPEHLGGNGDLLEKMKPIMDLPEDEKNKEAERLYRRVRSDLLDLPGLPPMHDYEHYPQKIVFDPAISFLSAPVYRLFNECDGIVMNTTPLFEGPSLKAWKSWFGNRPVINAGPTDFEIVVSSEEKSAETRKIIAFLDSILEKFGPDSVVYISFGSVWWTSEPEKVWAAIDVLIELNIPFLYSHASPFCVVPAEVAEKIKAYQFGLDSTWLPQTEILKHKACGWFVSHCGHNSVMESLSAGVPMICWPFEVDQPGNAANVALVHDMGYELFEVRSGYGLLPIHRNGNRAPAATVDSVRSEFRDVLLKARGEDGRRKRDNVLRFRAALAESWKDGGESWKELERIAKILRVKTLPVAS